MLEDSLERIDRLLSGRTALPLNPEDAGNPQEKAFIDRFNRLILFIEEMNEALHRLAMGELNDIRLSRENRLAFPIKELHSRLRHLAWQTQQVAQGDYRQQIDFMGEFSTAFNAMVHSLDRNERALKEKITALKAALGRVNRLEKLLPICMHCKRIRISGDDAGSPENWRQLDQHIMEQTGTEFSHSICPRCLGRHYPDTA
jgi:hypothetical protein